MNAALAPAIVETGIIAYRTMTGRRITVTKGQDGNFTVMHGNGPKRPPLPSELVAVFVVFGIYSIIDSPDNANRHRIAALLGWGTVIATFMTVFSSGSSGGTFPPGPTLSQRGQLTQPLPNLPNYPTRSK